MGIVCYDCRREMNFRQGTIVKLKNFQKTFKIGDREATHDELKQYVIEAYPEQSLGGDFLKTTIVRI